MKTIVLTHFWDAKNWDTDKIFSIARWQPKGFDFHSIPSLAPRYDDGQPIKGIPIDEYRRDYEDIVLARKVVRKTIFNMINSMKEDDIYVLCCWCNSKRQSQYKKLMCHRILVGYYIEDRYSEVKVVYVGGAENPVWEK